MILNSSPIKHNALYQRSRPKPLESFNKTIKHNNIYRAALMRLIINKKFQPPPPSHPYRVAGFFRAVNTFLFCNVRFFA